MFLPALRQIGFAPLLIAEVHQVVKPTLMLIAIAGLILQLIALSRVSVRSSLLRDDRFKLLLVALSSMLISLLLVKAVGLLATVSTLAYGLAVGCGVVLIARPVPQAQN